MRRTTSAAGGRPRSSAGRRRRPARHAEAVVTTGPVPAHSLTRRLAPLAAGAVEMLVATSIATLAQPTEQTSSAQPQLS
ncbi:MAG: hypothetical protein ACRDXB_05175, partial [Actinomycetes bacterium]